MRVGDILEHFLSRADWIDRETTVDRVIVGDPDVDVDRCLVTWMPTSCVLRHMAERGIRLLMCHEPTFWNHRDVLPTKDDSGGMAKLRYVREHGITIIRNHDCWDRWPGIGIPWAWARFLGLDRSPVAVSPNAYQHRYDITPTPLEAFSHQVAAQCGTVGEPFVQVTGDLSQMVSRIGIGTGCACSIPTYEEMGCDCSVLCDDGSCYWGPIQRAADLGHPVIRVNHGTSEEPGMATLTAYINEHLDGVDAEHLPHGSTFRLVGSGAGS